MLGRIRRVLTKGERGENQTMSKYRPLNNTPLLDVRNVAVCKNLHCSNTDEHVVNLEFCPDCRKRLTKTVKGSQLYELTESTQSTQQGE